MKKILFILTCLTSFYSFSQFEIKVENLTSNSQSINYCSTIDLGTSSSSTISLWANFKKPHAQAVGTSDLDIYIIGASGFRISKFHVVVFENQWFQGDANNPDTFSQYCSFPISSSDFNVSGGILFGVFKSSSNIEYQTACNYPIIKAQLPSFSLSPTSTNIACGDTNARTFTVTPANIPSGSTVTYQWSFSGWSGTANSSMSSVTLSPLSGTTLPSTVSVTPKINGVAHSVLYCSVSRPAFSSSATLSGNTVICPGNNGVYTISGLGAGNTVSWSSSNTAVATVSGGTQSQVIVNGLANGTANLIATITNACGQTVTKTKTINVGAPVLSGNVVQGELWVRKNFYPQTLTFPAVLGATSYTWVLTPDTVDFPPVCPTTGAVPAKFNNNLLTITTTTPSATASFGNCLGHYTVTCTVSNICGSTTAYELYVTVGNSGTSPCFVDYSLSKAFTVSQNPIKNGDIKIRKNSTLQIEDIDLGDDTPDPSIVDGDSPCYIEWPKVYNGLKMSNNQPKNSKSNPQVEVNIFDFFGKQVYTKTIDTSKEEISIKDSNLTSGKYILHINDGVNTQKEIIIIE